MEAIEAIYTRRSIRKYTDQSVPDSLINEVLKAAMYAPSAGNAQPWHFVVIRERHALDAIPKFHPHAEMMKDATVALVVCGDTTVEKYRGRWVLDCSAATQNILLAAHAKGLGAVWVGLHPEPARVENMRRLLRLPEHIMPLSLIPMGYPAEHAPAVDRFNPSRIHYDHW